MCGNEIMSQLKMYAKRNETIFMFVRVRARAMSHVDMIVITVHYFCMHVIHSAS